MARGKETADRAAAMKKLERLKGRPEQIKESDLEVAVADLSNIYLRCRDKGHKWPEMEDDEYGKTIFGNRTRDMTCERCGMGTHEVFRMDGTLISRSYSEPKGYYLVGTSDRKLGLKVRMVRAEVFRRVFGETK